MQRQQHSPQQAAITTGLMAEEHINTTTPDPLQSLLRDGLGQNNDEVTTMAAELLAQLENQLIGTTIGAVVVAEHQDRPGWRERLLQQVCNRRRRQTAGLKQQHRRGLLMPLGAAGHDGPAFGSQDDLVLQRPQLGAVLINIHSRKTLGHRASHRSHGGQRAPGGPDASGFFENGGDGLETMQNLHSFSLTTGPTPRGAQPCRPDVAIRAGGSRTREPDL